EVLPDFFELMRPKFSNKTNGVSPRRFLLLSNPRLGRLITDAIGPGWITDLDHLKKLEAFALDSSFRAKWRHVKHESKSDLSGHMARTTSITADPSSIFDVHTKRIHEYKRQHLNLLHVITIYNRMKRDPKFDITPRTVIFGGKAALGYFIAKLMIKLINSVDDTVVRHPELS